VEPILALIRDSVPHAGIIIRQSSIDDVAHRSLLG
jgi:hypothetical protein